MKQAVLAFLATLALSVVHTPDVRANKGARAARAQKQKAKPQKRRSHRRGSLRPRQRERSSPQKRSRSFQRRGEKQGQPIVARALRNDARLQKKESRRIQKVLEKSLLGAHPKPGVRKKASGLVENAIKRATREQYRQLQELAEGKGPIEAKAETTNGRHKVTFARGQGKNRKSLTIVSARDIVVSGKDVWKDSAPKYIKNESKRRVYEVLSFLALQKVASASSRPHISLLLKRAIQRANPGELKRLQSLTEGQTPETGKSDLTAEIQRDRGQHILTFKHRDGRSETIRSNYSADRVMRRLDQGADYANPERKLNERFPPR